MFVVYARTPGRARRPMGHFKAQTAAKAYGESLYASFPTDEIIIAEEADGARKNFVDAPERAPESPAAPAMPELTIEAAPVGTAKGGK